MALKPFSNAFTKGVIRNFRPLETPRAIFTIQVRTNVGIREKINLKKTWMPRITLPRCFGGLFVSSAKSNALCFLPPNEAIIGMSVKATAREASSEKVTVSA